MILVTLKLFVTPVLIVGVSLAARRWGPKIGGLFAGLPLTSAPIFAFLAVEQEPNFASRVAAGTLSGVASVGAFCLAYAARREALRMGCLHIGRCCLLSLRYLHPPSGIPRVDFQRSGYGKCRRRRSCLVP